MTETSTVPALNLSSFDTAIAPQDDLFRHVNGQWLSTAEIAADKPGVGSFVRLHDAAEAAVHDIITGLTSTSTDTESDKIADLYASFMDEETIEALGAEPLAPLLSAIDQAGTMDDLVRVLGGLARRGIAGLFELGADSDPGEPTRYVMFAGQDGISLPDEAYYRLEDYEAIRAEYRKHLAASFALAGFADADRQSDSVFGLETAIAARHWDKVKCRDLRLMYNLRSLDEVIASSSGLRWRTFLDAAQIPEQAMAEVVVAQPSFFTEVADLMVDERLAEWQAWARWKVITTLSPFLSRAFVDERFRFFGTILSGTPELMARWKRGVALVERSLGEAVGRIYVERHFSPVAKERMDALVANLIEAYRRSISGLDWMTEETKQRALTKLSKFRPHIGYPVRWRDYSALAIDQDDLVGNVQRAAEFELNRDVAKIGQPIDRDEWLMTPQTVNAYYHPLRNEIVFPAAILQPPFFNEHADDAVNYGGIGAVIGHEIGHGFDDQGSTCDGDGMLHDWWTAEDRAAFEQRTRILIGQYSALSPEETPGHFVNGDLTIGENIGDLGGLSIAHLAYTIARGDRAVEPRDGYADEQRFFLSWAAIWQGKNRPEFALQRLATDPHAPNEFRCNQIVRNVPAFYAAFGVAPEHRLWLAPDQRVSIW